MSPRSRLLTMIRSRLSGATPVDVPAPLTRIDDLVVVAVRARRARCGRRAPGAAGRRSSALQYRHGARVAELAERDDRLLLGGEAVAAEPGDQRRRDPVGRRAGSGARARAAARSAARRTAGAAEPSRHRSLHPLAIAAGRACGPDVPRRRWPARSGARGGEGASSSALSPCTSARCSCRRPRDRSSRRSCPCPRPDRGSRHRP